MLFLNKNFCFVDESLVYSLISFDNHWSNCSGSFFHHRLGLQPSLVLVLVGNRVGCPVLAGFYGPIPDDLLVNAEVNATK